MHATHAAVVNDMLLLDHGYADTLVSSLAQRLHLLEYS